VEAVTTIEMRQYKDLSPTLVKALEHLDETVAAAAVKAVGTLDLADLLPNLSKASARPNLTASARETIAAMLAKRPVKEVMKLAGSVDMVLRELAVLALVATAKNPQAKETEAILELLGETLKDKEPVIKRAAVQALNDIGGPKNWKRLLNVKGDTDPAIRILAISAASSLANEEGDAVIVEMLSDESDQVRITAVIAARDRGVKAAKPKLKVLVESRNKAEKLETLRTLVGLNANEQEHREYFDTYKTLLFDMDPEMQLAAIRGIQWIVDPTVPPLLESGILLMHKEGKVRAATILALGRSRDFNTIEFIARAFADPEVEVQKAGIEALKLLGHKKGIPPLEEFIKQTDDGELKALAQDAIDEINRPKGGLLD
jgi:HEAT repeat protein